MDNEDLLNQLADIHLPEAVTYWPPAPGWLILALLVFTGLIYLFILAFRTIRTRRFCNYALSELETCYQDYKSTIYESGTSSETTKTELVFVNQLNSVLRRVALNQYPDAGVAGLSGQAWILFLDSCSPGKVFPEDMAFALSSGRFSLRCEVDVEKLNELARKWISSQYVDKMKFSNLEQSTLNHA